MSNAVITATEQSFDALTANATKPLVVDFWAPWCQPCLRVSPVLDALAEERPDAVQVAKVNVDENPGLARRFNVQGIPTILRFDGGKETRRVVGALPKATLLAQLGLNA
ncbi:MAG: thioredoxin [Sulfobacillus thermosulfidooxidans]|uniref:Thioredoxin n=1 Tax=Sulfobacillus thermotolerans TaxID=338644 RepID=A0ABM6RMG0_9FIRM|nr:thioredoxin [Sulfobacillus sp. hq2]AUW92541.1 thioredoxin [Sulfobacillus thermotolerans]MCY0909862.1 thioredoxin [Sulfobacillus thermotolerans]POB11872.1 thioredoxin [Sulfobacillus sp. hq2]PSR36007.1 MAG: thioredoxin [Sulfobacillus thermosulfidooxidans]